MDNVVPIDRRPTVDVDRLERERAAAGPLGNPLDAVPLEQHPGRPGASTRERLAGDRLLAPRIVVAGDLVDELERQHRRAYRRRQEAKARARQRREALIYARDLLGLMLFAGTAGLVLFALAIELARSR